MLRLILTIFTMIAMAHVQLHAAKKTTCTTWQGGNYTVKIEGVMQNCTGKRTCTTTETDPDGQCRQVFGCSTTIEDQYSGCTKKAATRGPGIFEGGPQGSGGGVLDPGPRRPYRPPLEAAPATGGAVAQ